MNDAGLEHLTTARLTLRRFTPDDEALLYELNRSPQVMRFLGGPMEPEANREMLQERILAYYQQHPGLGVWATLERKSGRCIGFHLLNHVRGEADMIQVGYRLFEADWGRGYATEMTVALLRYGYVHLGLTLITANAHVNNSASHHVLLKCGLERMADRSFNHPAYDGFGELAHFEREANEWLTAYPAERPRGQHPAIFMG